MPKPSDYRSALTLIAAAALSLGARPVHASEELARTVQAPLAKVEQLEAKVADLETRLDGAGEPARAREDSTPGAKSKAVHAVSQRTSAEAPSPAPSLANGNETPISAGYEAPGRSSPQQVDSRVEATKDDPLRPHHTSGGVQLGRPGRGAFRRQPQRGRITRDLVELPAGIERGLQDAAAAHDEELLGELDALREKLLLELL